MLERIVKLTSNFLRELFLRTTVSSVMFSNMGWKKKENGMTAGLQVFDETEGLL